MGSSTTVKVYVFHNAGGEFAGWTLYKKIAKQCVEERPHWYPSIKKMSVKRFQAMAGMYSDLSLFENVMDDGGETVIFPITTYKENDLLEVKLSTLQDRLNDIWRELYEYPLKQTVWETLDELLSSVSYGEAELHLDIIKVYLRYVADYNK